MRHDNRKRRRLFTWFRLGLLGVLALAAGSLYTPYPARLVAELRKTARPAAPAPAPKPQPAPAPVEQPQPETPPAAPASPPAADAPKPWKPEGAFAMPAINLPPFPPALPERVENGRFEHINSIANGINLRSSVMFKPGTTASADRKKKEAYMVHISMDLLTPHAANGEELAKANPRLPDVLAAYKELMLNAKVSPWFASLYLHKQTQVRKTAATITKLLDRHNFYDTDTLLEIKAPQSGRHVLWLQADMDVVSDGSDGDRLPQMPDSVLKSDHYQPSTSYRWKKTGTTKNPLLPKWEAKLDALTKNKKASREAVADARAVVNDLKSYSFLLAEYDPFIVIPLTFKEGKDDAFRPKPGDYAAVVVDNRVFPAIVGDYGPRYKAGEASLRLAKLVNPKATSYARPVSDLTVSYLIFPNSREQTPSAPDYERLNSRVQELLKEIGGLGAGASYQTVEDLLKPKPEADAAAAPAAPKA